MFFSSPLDEDMVSRVEQDEDEERIAERAIEANGGVPRKVFPVWSQAARDRIAERGSLSPDVLLVAAGDFACDLVHDGVAAGGISLSPLGALAVAGVTAKGLTLEPSADDDACVVHDLGGGVAVAAARYRIPVESAREWAAALVNAVEPGRVVVLCAVDEHDVGYGVDGYRGAFVLDTAAQRSGMHSLNILDDDDDAATIQPAKTLPAGALLEGVPAAVAARCEMRGIPARVVAVPAPTGTAGARGFGDGRRCTAVHGPGARRIGVGPGFGGGVDGRAASHAVRLTQRACGMDFGVLGGVTPGVGVGASSKKPTSAVVDDGMRVYT